MSEIIYRWVKIADDVSHLQFGANHLALADAGDKKITVARFEDQLYAFAFKCPHASGILADGWIDPLGNVVCPVHRYKYNIKNGRNVSEEGYYLPHYPVELREDGVYVGLK